MKDKETVRLYICPFCRQANGTMVKHGEGYCHEQCRQDVAKQIQLQPNVIVERAINKQLAAITSR